MHGAGHYLCSIVVLPLDKALVTSWLPDVLELAPQSITAEGTHPVNILFGDERDVYASIIPFLKIDYMEFAFVIPFVQWKDTTHKYRGPFLYTPLLFLNKLLPILAGKILYGYPKRDAVMTLNDGHYSVVEKGDQIITGDFTPTTQAPDPQQADIIHALLQQPDLSKSIFGPWIDAVFDWGVLSGAKIVAQSADIDIKAGLLPNQPELKRHVSGFPGGTTDDGAGVYHIDTHWTLTAPRLAR